MKSLHLILVLFSIASMFTSFGVYDVDATKENNNGKSVGCYNNGEAKNNPHCVDGDPSSSTKFTACNVSEDGSIDAQDLVDYTFSLGIVLSFGNASNLITGADLDSNGVDTRKELRSLNNMITDLGFTCS